VIMRALDKSPTKRFLTVRQFVDEVGRVARGEGSVRATAPMGRAGRPKAELVQTLLGVRGSPAGAAFAAAMAQAAPAQAASSSAAAAASAPAEAAPAAPFMPPGALPAIPEPQVAAMQGASSGAARPAPLEAPPMAAAAAVAERSPWSAPPGAQAAQPAVQAQPAAQAPAAQAPAAQTSTPAAAAEVRSPVTQPPAESHSGTGSRKKKDDKDKSKGKFRETLWFKKGEMDAEAAEERARTGRDTGGERSDSLPMDERYKDDGSISRGDKERYSLRTGGTEMMPRLRDSQGSAKISEDDLIGEMKAGRLKILAIIGAAVIVLILIIVLVALR